MEICLLCLELRHESVEFIKIDSIKLPDDEAVEDVIEKHLWPMESVTSNSWFCRCCWQTLYEFHKFYTRIEEAHEDLAHMLDADVPFHKATPGDDRGEHSSNNELTIRFEGPHSSACLAEPQLAVGDIIPMEMIEENVTKLSTDENQNLNTLEEEEGMQQCAELIDEEELQSRSQTPFRGEEEHDELNVEESQESRDSEITAENDDKPQCTKDPLNRQVSLLHTENAENTNNDNILYKISMHNELSSRNSEISNDVDESDSSSSELSTKPGKKRKLQLDVYDKLPKNQRDEDDRVIRENIQLKCEICHEILATFHRLRAHYKKQHNKLGYIKCCNKIFRRRNLLADHQRLHLNPEYFKCQHCGKLLAERRCLDSHIANIHKTRGKCHACDICGKSFADVSILRNHKVTHLSEEEKQFPCTLCKKNFGSKYLLTNHIRAVHIKKYIKICDVCGKKFQVRVKFERHMLEHKGIAQTGAECDICGFKSVDAACLKRHKQSQHPEGGKTEYECHICKRMSPSLRAHRVHVRYTHQQGCNYQCTMCEKSFKRPYALREHMAIHTDTDLYTCPYCPMTFKSNANMHKHRKILHPVEWENARREKYSGALPPTNQKPATY